MCTSVVKIALALSLLPDESIGYPLDHLYDSLATNIPPKIEKNIKTGTSVEKIKAGMNCYLIVAEWQYLKNLELPVTLAIPVTTLMIP